MQNNQNANTSLLSLKQWLAVFLTLSIILLTVVLAILIVFQFENSLSTNLVTIFGLVGTTIGILSLPFFNGSLRLLGAFMRTLRVAIGFLTLGFASGFTRLIKHLPPRWNYVLLILSLAANIYSFQAVLKGNVLTCQDGNNNLQIIKEKSGEDIGISNGCEVFTSKSISNAYQAETDIYKNNPSIKSQHITLIVATMLSGTDTSSLGSGTALLQGVAIAQQEYNKQVVKHNSDPIEGQSQLSSLRLLIANTGSNEGYADEIARQIVQLSQHDSSIIGVVGWPFSTKNAFTALQTLTDAHIPSVSSSLSSDAFTSISPYFFRVVPPNTEQAKLGASFLEGQGVKHVVLCVDYLNPYSSSLATDFLSAFNKPGSTITKEIYTRGDLSYAIDPSGKNANALGTRIKKDFQADSSGSKAVYFAGYANDLDPLRGFLSPKQDSDIIIMGGDGLDEYGASSTNNYPNYKNIYFTTFSSYPIWDFPAKQPCFISDYGTTFNKYKAYNLLDYAFAENDAILAYDATTALLMAYETLPASSRSHPTPQDIKNQLKSISFWGVSGQITLGPEGDPTNKAVYVNQVTTTVDPAGLIQFGQASDTPDTSKIHFPLCESIRS